MSKKQSRFVCYALVVSIILVLAALVGLGIRAFESAGISGFIFVAAMGVLFAALAAYFVLRRPVAGTG